MVERKSEECNLRAQVDFVCIDEECNSVIQFNVMDVEKGGGGISCPVCHREYRFDEGLVDKLRRLRSLIFAIQGASEILGDVEVAVQTPSHEVKVPYNLLLTRMNTMITLEVGGRHVQFHFRIEPLNDGAMR
jgi:hypothetical protein